mgnify:CR=1 FL=1
MKIKKYTDIKNILILHGYGTNPNECFYKNMFNSLLKSGHSVKLPLLPNADNPNDIEQKNSIKGKFDILVAHSFGCVTALRYAEENKLELMILISGFVDNNFSDGDPDIEILKNSSTWKFNFDKIKSNCKKIYVLYPYLDTSVTQSQVKKLASLLECKIIKFQQECDHACGDKEYDLVKLVNKLI